MANREKSTQPTSADEFRDAIQTRNRQTLEQEINILLDNAGSVNSCFEQTQSLLRAAILTCMADGERSEDDMSAIADLLLTALNFTRIGYSRYLLGE